MSNIYKDTSTSSTSIHNAKTVSIEESVDIDSHGKQYSVIRITVEGNNGISNEVTVFGNSIINIKNI